MKHIAAVPLVATVLFSGLAVLAQVPDKSALTSITLQSGANIIGEVRSENAAALVVFDLNTGDERTIKIAEIKTRNPATETVTIGRVGLPRYLAWRVKKELNGPATGKIAEVTPSSIYLTLGSKDGIEVGNVFTVFRDEGEVKDPDTGNVIGKKRAKLARLEVTEAQDSYCKAKRIGDTEVEIKAKDVVEQEGVNLAVAVMPILDIEGDETTAGKTLAEQISTMFVNRGITLVERERLNAALTELSLQQSKTFDPEAVQKVGKQLGAVAVVVGTITPKGKRAEAHVRLIRVQTGEALVAASQDVTAVGEKVAGASGKPKATTAANSRNRKAGFAKQLVFATEKDMKENWQINAPDSLWSIENNGLKFSAQNGFPQANVSLRYKLHGDVALDLLGTMQNSTLTIHLFGEQISVNSTGAYRVQILREGTTLKINNNGQFTTKLIKESWGEEPTGLQLSWRVNVLAPSNCFISSVGLRATKAQEDKQEQ